MAILNDPLPMPEDEPKPDWSPEVGFRRALVRGSVVTLVVALLMSPLYYFMPAVVMQVLVRVALTLLVGWIIFRAVQGAAGMTSWPLTGLATVLTLVAFLLQSVTQAIAPASVWAVEGGPNGWQWLTLEGMFYFHLVNVLSLPLCVLLFHSGPGPGGFTVLGEVLTMGVWGTRR